MRNLLLAGTAGLLLTFGAADAYAVPQNSPYAVMVPPGAVDGATPDNGAVYMDQGYGDDGLNSDGSVEGRAAFVDADEEPIYADPGYGYYSDPWPIGGYNFGGGRMGHFGGGHFHGGHFGGGPRHR